MITQQQETFLRPVINRTAWDLETSVKGTKRKWHSQCLWQLALDKEHLAGSRVELELYPKFVLCSWPSDPLTSPWVLLGREPYTAQAQAIHPFPPQISDLAPLGVKERPEAHGQHGRERAVGMLMWGTSSNVIEICLPIWLPWNLKMLLMRFGIPQSRDFNIAMNFLSFHLGCKPDEHCYLSIDEVTVIDLAVGVTCRVQMSRKKPSQSGLNFTLSSASTQQTPVRNIGSICSFWKEQRKNSIKYMFNFPEQVL